MSAPLTKLIDDAMAANKTAAAANNELMKAAQNLAKANEDAKAAAPVVPATAGAADIAALEAAEKTAREEAVAARTAVGTADPSVKADAEDKAARLEKIADKALNDLEIARAAAGGMRGGGGGAKRRPNRKQMGGNRKTPKKVKKAQKKSRKNRK